MAGWRCRTSRAAFVLDRRWRDGAAGGHIAPPIRPSAQSHIEIIRFAAANRLLVELDYQGGTRRIEPYSLRRTRDDNFVLHAWNVDSDAHRSYRVDRIEGARTTSQVFEPRYAVELTPSGSLMIARTTASPRPARTFRSTARGTTRRAGSVGPTYIYQCEYCGKKFRRKKQSPKLNKHKSPDGWPCTGRTGWLVDTKY